MGFDPLLILLSIMSGVLAYYYGEDFHILPYIIATLTTSVLIDLGRAVLFKGESNREKPLVSIMLLIFSIVVLLTLKTIFD